MHDTSGGFDNQNLIRYRLAEYGEALDRDGWCCWLCGRPLTNEYSGRAHRIADNKMNRKKYGSWVIDHRDNFYMSCNNCNSYATKYKKDTKGDITFKVIVETTANGTPAKADSCKLSRFTEDDKEKLIAGIRAKLETRGIQWGIEPPKQPRIQTLDVLPDHKRRAILHLQNKRNVLRKGMKYKSARYNTVLRNLEIYKAAYAAVLELDGIAESRLIQYARADKRTHKAFNAFCKKIGRENEQN